ALGLLSILGGQLSSWARDVVTDGWLYVVEHSLRLQRLPPYSTLAVQRGRLFGDGVIQPHLVASFRSLAIGFGISLVGGLAIGIAMGLSTRIFTALDIYVNAMLFVPALTFAPILFAAFGLSDTTRIAVVVMYALFIIIINTAAGIRDVDDPLIDMAASFGASRAATVRRVILPAAVPLILAGIRLSVGRAV